jgi:hypothetical protein
MRRRTCTALTVLAGAFVVLPSSGCDCELECDDRPPVSREVVGTVTQIEDGVITLDVADAPDELQVAIYGRASALDVGETYRVPLHELPPDDIAGEDLVVDLPSANLQGSCDCGAPFITHTDGEEVDTGILPSLPLRKFGWAFLAAASIAVVTWATLRVIAAEPL